MSRNLFHQMDIYNRIIIDNIDCNYIMHYWFLEISIYTFLLRSRMFNLVGAVAWNYISSYRYSIIKIPISNNKVD